MEVIKPEDPRYFTHTSDVSYDRHRYELIFDSGKESVIFNDYEQMRAYWFECVRNWKNCKINVLDKKQKSGGFI